MSHSCKALSAGGFAPHATVGALRYSALCLVFDMVQLTDARQSFQRHRTLIGLVQIEELRRACAQQPNSMQGDASWRAVENNALYLRNHRQQVALPCSQELTRVLAATPPR